MAKLPSNGATAISPRRGNIGLLAVANFAVRRLNLRPCSTKFLRKIHLELAGIIGKSQASRADARNVQKCLGAIAKAAHLLHRVLYLQSGFSELRPDELEARGRLVEWLGLNPVTHDTTAIDRTAEDVLNIAHAAEAAAMEIKSTHFAGGAPQLAWYRDFTELSIRICKKFGLSTTLHRDKFNEPTGPLFQIASQLERLLPTSMRSRTAETRFKRLKNALKTINSEEGKNPSDAG